MNELSALISRKEKLLKQREVLKRKQDTETKDGRDIDSDIVEDSDTEIPPTIPSSRLHQMCLPITNEESTKDRKINIISEFIISPTKKQVTDDAPHNSVNSECVAETGLQSTKAGSEQVNSTNENNNNIISEADMDALHNLTDFDIVEDSDNELPPIISNSSLRSQRNVTVCSTDDEPSNDSINTSTICLPLDHSFFQPSKGFGLGNNNASASNTNTNNASRTFSDELNSDARQYISLVNSPLEHRIHHSTMNECTTSGISNNVTNNSASSLPENRQMCIPITNEESDKNKKINIISEVIIRPKKKIATDDASHNSVNSECVAETGLQSTRAGSAQVNSTSENLISEADMDTLRNLADFERAIETKLEPFKASSENRLTGVINTNDPKMPSPSNGVHKQYELASCSSRQDNFNCLFEGDSGDGDGGSSSGGGTPSVVNKSITSSQIDNGRKKRSATRFQKAYMDFKVEEDIRDFSSGSSDNWSPKETENDSPSETKKKAKKKN